MDGRYPHAADHYGIFRELVFSSGSARASRLMEPLAGDGGGDESEMEIQARWFGGEFGREFVGVDGERIEVVQWGHWNRGAGPDFTDAAVRIDGELKAGPIELDIDARDWERHGHGSNPAFEETALHVFTDGPALSRFYTRTAAHRQVCQLQLPQYAWAQGPPDFLPEAYPGRCVAPLQSMGNEEVESLLSSAAQYRFRQKSARLGVMAGATSREQALFQGIAEALGYRQNKTAMAVLAQRCPIEELLKLDAMDCEARLFGAAGFLRQDGFGDRADEEAKRYLSGLWARWWKMRDRIEPSSSRSLPWCFSGSRPINHPQRRVGALVSIVQMWDEVMAWWEQPVNNLEKRVNNSLKALHHAYWDWNYTLKANPSESALSLLGKDRQRDLLGNVVFPVVMGDVRDSEAVWQQYCRLGKVATNQHLRRATLRLFGEDRDRQKLFTKAYHQQQGLLQIYHDFCLQDVSNCEACQFPEQLMQWRVHSQPPELQRNFAIRFAHETG